MAAGAAGATSPVIFGKRKLQTVNSEPKSAEEKLQSMNEQLRQLNDDLLRQNRELAQAVSQAQGARAQAERANNANDELLATLSHELRTPLSSILLNAQRIGSGDVLDHTALQLVGGSLEHATRLQVKLIDDLLDASRLAAGMLTLELRPLDLGRAVRAALDNVSVLVEAKALVLTVTIDPDLPPIWADAVRVHQVTMNLLMNAIKFTPSGERVTVVVDAVAGLGRLRVADTGIGIAPDFLPHVFAHFSQSDTSTTRRYGGLGLGLALVRTLVELHGGAVRAESDGPGLGAAFSVTFPMARALDTDNADAAAPLPPTRTLDLPSNTKSYDALTGLRVLFIDDDLRTREAVQEVLRLAGAHVALAASAAEGLSAVGAFHPQVILCDIAMPDEDGYAFIRKLRGRASAEGALIPALALTALSAEDDRRRALAAGFQLHLAKPIDIDRLRDAVFTLSQLKLPEGGRKPPSPGTA